MLSSLTSFLSARRRGLTYAAATVGGAYVAGRWAVQRVLEGAERGRREGWGKEECVSPRRVLSRGLSLERC